MGIFYQMADVVNRAPVAINVRFDGQDIALTPGINRIPKVAIQYAKNQNPIMGSQDPENPHISGGQFLIGVVGSRDNCTPLTEEEWATHCAKPCRMDTDLLFEERYGNDPKAKMIVRGKPSGGFARSRTEAGRDIQAGDLSTNEHEK